MQSTNCEARRAKLQRVLAMRSFLLTLGVAMALASAADAQFAFQPAPPPPSPPPLMYVRFAGPKGGKLTLYRGIDAGKTFDLPCVVGFRPGYSYRLALSDMEGFPRQVFFPTLEVRGSMILGPRAQNSDYPAHLRFSVDELE